VIPHRQQVLDTLAQLGPSTSQRIAFYLKVDALDWVTSVTSRMARGTPRRPQQLHVIGWSSNDAHGKRAYPRAVYALGPGENVPQPPPDTQSRRRASQARSRKRAAAWRMSSPFHLGVSAHAARYSENRK
jgi:hypothetical protein